MPVSGWNGKFQQVGNGAFAGSIQYAALGEALRRGYAAASTDTGHTGPGAAWALGHPEKIADFGHRAVHETAVHSKSAISNFYGMAPKLSYFTGCSGGGRMAFQEAQQGWADPNVSPRSPLMYYDRVVKTVGRKAVDEGMRLFYAPGMGHCGGGEGPNVFDALTPLEQWREQGKPPSSILATHSTAGKVDRSRPLCPYPQIARYKGTGSIDQAENFSCAAPAE